MKINDIIKSGREYSESKAAVLNIVYTERLLSEKISAILKNYDLSTEQFNVLRILRGQKGTPASMQLIQERMLSKTSNTTRLVDKLLAKKLLTRKICPNNRRMMEVNITEAGLGLLDKADPDIELFEESFQHAMSVDELEHFNRAIEKLRLHLSNNT